MKQKGFVKILVVLILALVVVVAYLEYRNIQIASFNQPIILPVVSPTPEISPPPPILDSQTGWKIYTSNKIGYSVEIPSEWNVSQKENGEETWPEWNLVAHPADFWGQNPGGVWINFPIAINGPHTNDFDKLYENGLDGLVTENVPSDTNFYASRQTSFITIGGKRALIIKTVNNSKPPSADVPDWCGDCRSINYYIDLGNKSILTFECTWQTSVPEMNEKICTQIISTFKFTK